MPTCMTHNSARAGSLQPKAYGGLQTTSLLDIILQSNVQESLLWFLYLKMIR